MKKNSTKKALLLSVLSLLLCVSMLIGTTYAWFTDTVTSAGNKIVAGTLDVDLLMADKLGAYASIADKDAAIFGGEDSLIAQNDAANTLWEPGKTQIVYLGVENKGSLDLKYNIVLSVTDGGLVGALEYAIVDGAKFGDIAATKWADIEGNTNAQIGDIAEGIVTAAPNGEIKANEDVEYFALAVHMKEEAGNEYQGKDITIDVAVVATQLASEEDSFGTDYDAAATMPLIAFGVGSAGSESTFTVPLIRANGSKGGSAFVPVAAVADDNEDFSLFIVEAPLVDNNIVLTSDQAATTYNITARGLKEGNTEDIKVELNIGTGLTGVALYHYGEEITNAVYNESTGNIIFYTDSFSPFTVVYDAVAQEETPSDTTVPSADVTKSDEYANADISWTSFGGFAPSDYSQKLEAAYTFVAPHNVDTVGDSAYKDWYCDFVVSIDRDIEEGQLFLGGFYEIFNDTDWVGFENPIDVAADEEIPLLGSVTNSPWTYEMIASFVNTFKCGVARANGTDLTALEGATFTVKLCLTNPENTDEVIDVNTVEYTFGTNFGEGTSVIK